MTDTIIQLLNEAGIEHWTVLEKQSRSDELFFIRRNMDMFRSKDVTKYTITVYRDHFEKDRKYRGSATLTLDRGMERDEIREKLNGAYGAASHVKNPWYPLPSPVTGRFKGPESRLSESDRTALLRDMGESLFVTDTHSKGGINSCEVFLNSFYSRFISSEGSDCTFDDHKGDIELICDWNEHGRSVELYNMFSFSDYSGELIESECRRQIENCRLRAAASEAPELRNINIILGEEAVREIMDFYRTHSNIQGVYEGTAKGKKGEVFQGSEVRGDLIDITLTPSLAGSPSSSPVDRDGVLLKETRIYKKGKILNYHGPAQYAFYLKEEPVGCIENTIVSCGSRSVEEWRREPHVEILAFSDFQMDSVTGNFGGEVRLARYFNGKEETALTGASISASLFDVHKEIYLSSEKLEKENYSGPRHIMIPGASLAGG